MALINCPKCKKEVSNTVKKCIHCGSKLRKRKIKKDDIFKIIMTALIILAIGFVMFTLFNINNRLKNIENNLKYIKYKVDNIEYTVNGIESTVGSIEYTVNDIYYYLP